MPLLVRVTVCTVLGVPKFWAPKFKLVAVRTTTAPTPVPFKVTICGLSGAVSAMLTVAVRAPSAAGLNFTIIVQVPTEAAKGLDETQLSLSLNSLALVPVTVTPVMVRAAVPVFVRVMVCAALWVPTF